MSKQFKLTILSPLGVTVVNLEIGASVTMEPIRQERPLILEASCGGCGETFCPNDETDLYHLQKEDGTECGAKAKKVIGYYLPRERESDGQK